MKPFQRSNVIKELGTGKVSRSNSTKSYKGINKM
jgi:hypothetical protein